ncbi:MAG TPA: hypothetical protein VGK73_25105 [Polyangiaceae bacterium]
MRLVGTGAGEVVLYIHTHHAPNRAEWADAMGLLAGAVRRGGMQNLRSLVITDGGGPDAEMRAQLKQLYERERLAMPTAVVAGSVLVRSIVGAISWFSPSIKSFSFRALDEALRFLELPASAKPRILEAARSMQQTLPLVTCLRLIENAQSELA